MESKKETKIDEFDTLLTHPHFSKAEFLGGLRSLAIQEGLQLITASLNEKVGYLLTRKQIQIARRGLPNPS